MAAVALFVFVLWAAGPGTEARVRTALAENAYDLAGPGRALLLNEADRASFFMLGELHGDNETPALLRDLWPELWRRGYRHVAAEVSPWMSQELVRGPGTEEAGLWRRRDARFVASFARKSGSRVLWGCDMEEIRPGMLVRRLAQVNPNRSDVRDMLSLAGPKYRREDAPELLRILRAARNLRDDRVGGTSLLASLRATLEIDTARLDRAHRLGASQLREKLMKELFLEHYRSSPPTKVMLRFGRNHLHRGYDRRGVSTLGNFVAEFALEHGTSAFNIAEFAAGGQLNIGGNRLDADERSEDPALELLAGIAPYAATVFDLRPLRKLLHGAGDLSPALSSLLYWADSYDAILCFRTATPLQ